MNEDLKLLSNEELINIISKMRDGGVSLSFNGKRSAEVIQRKVRPRQVSVDKNLSFGSDSNNVIIDGENLQAMVTLFKDKGKVDLILTDPPYNTGKDFRYNDKWDKDPNDPDLGELVTLEDGSRHTKWMKFMVPRLKMMKSMLKPNGVLAICIDERELFHLGMLLNELFGEENRIGLINWQKSYAPKNDSKHLSTATEYILVYSKDKENVKTNLLARTEQMNNKYKNPDNDPEGDWRSDNALASRITPKDRYGIQSPFTGAIHYPGSSWRNPQKDIKTELEKYGVSYILKDLKDGRPKALIIKGAVIPEALKDQNFDSNPIVSLGDQEMNLSLKKAQKSAMKLQERGVLPNFYFGKKGQGRPAIKRHMKNVKKGKVALTYWADDEYDEALILDSQSWEYTESGHSQTGIKELDKILGKGHGFQTVKPLQLMMKIIQLWCPPDGLVVDPFAGSGTTGHAVLQLNRDTNATRNFTLIEKGEEGDRYTESLTRERIKRALTGERVDKSGNVKILDDPIESGFEFWRLKKEVDAKAIMKMQKEDLVDMIISSYFDDNKRKDRSTIIRENEEKEFLFGRNVLNEGFFIIWEKSSTGDPEVGKLTLETYLKILEEAKSLDIKTPYHIYARYEHYQTEKVKFYPIPDNILLKLGLNENSEKFYEEEE